MDFFRKHRKKIIGIGTAGAAAHVLFGGDEDAEKLGGILEILTTLFSVL